MSAFSHYNIIGAFGLSVERLSQMFLCVEASYCYTPEAPNTYHTHVHAADVTLTVSHFLSVEAIANTVRSTHGLALLMAAIMHDYRHPGVRFSQYVGVVGAITEQTAPAIYLTVGGGRYFAVLTVGSSGTDTYANESACCWKIRLRMYM